MRRQRENPQSPRSASPTDGVRLSPGSGSHQMTLHQPLRVEGDQESFLINPTEYHLTIRLTHETLSRRELSLLLDVLNYQAVTWGISLTMYLAMTDLYFRLLGSKLKASEVSDFKISKVLVVTEILLRLLKDQEFSLDGRQVLIVNEKVRSLLEPALMSRRTYGSRYSTWRPEKFFVVRIVPVDNRFTERRRDSEPYSSYCKGYGESHPSARSQRTKPSLELDSWTPTEVEAAEQRKLFSKCTNPDGVLVQYLRIGYENLTGVDL